jgi:hypothetical protein
VCVRENECVSERMSVCEGGLKSGSEAYERGTPISISLSSSICGKDIPPPLWFIEVFMRECTTYIYIFVFLLESFSWGCTITISYIPFVSFVWL